MIPTTGAAAVGAINAAIQALSNGVPVNKVSPGAIMTERRLSMLEKAAASEKITLKKPSGSSSSGRQ